MKRSLWLLLLFLSLPVLAQYPFEKHPAIHVKKYATGYSIDGEDTYDYEKVHHISIPKFFGGKQNAVLKINPPDTATGKAIIEIYQKQHKTKQQMAIYGFGTFSAIEAFYVADYNHDGLPDIKFIIPHFGCGAYNYYCDVVYWLQNANHTLNKVSFNDLLLYDYQNRPERDLDGDGVYEIVVCSFQSYKSHNYLLYNLYHLEGTKLVNVNSKFHYPIMIQLLYAENYRITKHLTRAQMKQFERQLPDDYEAGKL